VNLLRRAAESALSAPGSAILLPIAGGGKVFQTLRTLAAHKGGALFIFQVDRAVHAVKSKTSTGGKCPKAHPVHLVPFRGLIHCQKQLGHAGHFPQSGKPCQALNVASP